MEWWEQGVKGSGFEFMSSHAKMGHCTPALCQQLRQASAQQKVQKCRSLRRSHQVLSSCGGMVSEQGLGMACRAHTAPAPWGQAVNSGFVQLWSWPTEPSSELRLWTCSSWWLKPDCFLKGSRNNPSPAAAWRMKIFWVGKSQSPKCACIRIVPLCHQSLTSPAAITSGKLMGSMQTRRGSLNQQFGETEASLRRCKPI